MGQMHRLSNFNLNIDLKLLITSNPELKGAGGLLADLKKYVQPFILWRDMEISEKESGLTSFDNGGLQINSRYVASGLQECSGATLLACTIGSELPNYTNECLIEGRIYEGTIADIFGSHVVEILADQFHQYLKSNNLPRGKFSTLRFSPGYGDWQLKDQKKIISYLDKAEGIIKVGDNYLLEPVKSITALIGWSTVPRAAEYPQGNRKSSFCHGGNNCAHCITWACKKY